MTLKTPEQVAEEAARTVLTERDMPREGGEQWLAALCWALGDGIEYEAGLTALVIAAIEADRAQRLGGYA